MRIRSTTVDGHQFTRARRGYDPSEVEAVMARIADTLRDYEDLTEDLEARIVAAETAARVAKPKAPRHVPNGVDAAHEHADEIMRRAEEEVARQRAEIASLLDAAREEAEELRRETDRARGEVEAERSALAEARAVMDVDTADVRSRAEADAAAVLEEARAEATAITRLAREEAEALLATALEEVALLRAEAKAEGEELRSTRLREAEEEIERRRVELDEHRRRTEEEARHTAEILETAEADRKALESRVETLKASVETIETQMRALSDDIAWRAGELGGPAPAAPLSPAAAEASSSEASPVEMEMPAYHAPDEYAIPAAADPSAVVVLGDDETTIDVAGAGDSSTGSRHDAYAEPDGSGRPPAERPTIVPDASPDHSDTTDDHQGPYRTVYQRAGRNLRARLRHEGQDPTQRGR